MDAAALRAQFPVLERVAFLNAGTDGPVPAAAVGAAREALDAQLDGGRYAPHFEARLAAQDELRAFYARLLGAPAGEVALTTSTSEGIGKVLAGLELGPGDEIVTSEQEHPGLRGPLLAARRRGVKVTAVPLKDVADAVTSATTLVACSHVSWVTGSLAPDMSGLDVPVLLDGAQGIGAIPVDVKRLSCAAYAASGQKWLCGADGTGALHLDPAFSERVRVVAPSWSSFADPEQGELHAGARRHDTPSLPRETAAMSLAAGRILEQAGLDAVHTRAAELAAELAQQLAARGRTVAPRARTTLVAWEDPDPPASRQRLADAGVIVRNLPGTPYLRASVGAWNDERDLERLLFAL
jgi:selenocysteine lyase/cysteine desulfurase